MPNMKKRIGRHNRTVLNSETEEEVEPCVCTQFACPLDGDCGKKNVVYQAEVTTEDGRTEYYMDPLLKHSRADIVDTGQI